MTVTTPIITMAEMVCSTGEMGITLARYSLKARAKRARFDYDSDAIEPTPAFDRDEMRYFEKMYGRSRDPEGARRSA